MVRHFFFIFAVFIPLTAFAIDVPPLENARGIVVHNSVSSSPFDLQVGKIQNCKETEDHFRIDCELKETLAQLGDIPVHLTELRYVTFDDGDQGFYMFGTMTFRNGDFAAEEYVRIVILKAVDGSKRGHIAIEELGITEQIVLGR